MNTLQQSYDNTPYPDLSYTQTHPDRLAALGTLLGLSPAPVDRCRVLDLGCASGGNIIPMAYSLPHSTFVGVDFAARQIEMGQTAVTQLGLQNIELRAENILDLPVDFGEFDYIIAHGVYSWVPEAVREQLLAICKGSLAPNGIAYISYNTFPGWHMLGAIREMMRYHTRNELDAPQRARQARDLIAFMAEGIVPEDPYNSFGRTYSLMLHAYDQFITKERSLEDNGDDLLLHDELEEVNTAVYFHEFVDHAAQYGLQYLVEADFARVVPTNFKPEVTKKLYEWAQDSIEIEQYMDFLRNRSFRQTLLVHDDVPLSRRLQPTPALMAKFWLATYSRPTHTDIDIKTQEIANFEGPDGSKLRTDHIVTKAAMQYLAEIAPQSVSFTDLLQMSWARVYGSDDPGEAVRQRDTMVLIANLLQGYSYSNRLIELHAYRPLFTLTVGERPFASQFARLQAAQGLNRVTNLRHERVKLAPLSRLILSYLDGRHTPDDLFHILLAFIDEGQLTFDHPDKRPLSKPEIEKMVKTEIDTTLNWLAHVALLEK